ncbi:hypothetical protein BM221_001356 [Beauveria bassiana]|uniref:Uncharacterized protein n=1 Tax=Beauveria bassiana TaxID=176275 RepID=A0A2N6P323_BEABA|nr:hypothetical protein BM221_001356 [Beauveria bassiana]
MKASFVVAFMVGTAVAAVIPARAADSDEAVVYPAQVDQSWVDAQKRSQDSDEAVVYPAQVDQSWVDAQ